MFRRWIDQRGGVGPAELREGVEAIRAFLFKHGMSRFEPAWEGRLRELEGRLQEVVFRDRAGFRKHEAITAGDDKSDDETPLAWDFYIDVATWKIELSGFDPAAIGREMAKQGWLVTDRDGHLAKQVRIPSFGRSRLYHVKAAFLGG